MLRVFGVVVVLGLSAGSCLADAIDGDWCEKGRNLSIKGPEITTPDGHTLSGTYHRHQFEYVIPTGESDAGSMVLLQLVSDDYMHRFAIRDGKVGAPELWRRCDITS